jgi:hypothetical protein
VDLLFSNQIRGILKTLSKNLLKFFKRNLKLDICVNDIVGNTITTSNSTLFKTSKNNKSWMIRIKYISVFSLYFLHNLLFFIFNVVKLEFRLYVSHLMSPRRMLSLINFF